MSGYDGGDLPDYELPGDVEGIVDIEGDDRVPRRGKRLQPAVEGGVPGQPQAHEQPVVCAMLRAREGFAVDREDPLALLAGALGDQLFDPGPQRRHGGGGGQGQLVAACHSPAGDGGAEKETGVVLLEPALFHRFTPPLQQALDVDAGETSRHHPEERKRRVAPPDVGVVEEEMAETETPGQLLEAAAGVGDGDEPVSRSPRSEGIAQNVVEVLEEGEGLDRASRLGGGDEEGPRQVEPPRLTEDGCRIGAVEHGEVLMPGAKPKMLRNTSGARLDPPMPRRRAWVQPLSQTASTTGSISRIPGTMASGLSIHPMRLPISAGSGDQRVWSLFQMRWTTESPRIRSRTARTGSERLAR